MNKSELIAAIAAKTGSTKKDAEASLNAFVDAVTDDAAPAGFTATRVADGGVNYQVVTIIKDVEITGTCPVDGRVLVVRAEKNVTITKTDDTVLGDISYDGELLLGLPYDTEEITYNSQVTGNLFEGTGNLTINNGVIDNTNNAAGTAINLNGEASKVTINGGTIKNFKVGVQLSDTTSLKLAGSFEGCAQTFAGTGTLVIDTDFALSDTTINNTAFNKVLINNITLNTATLSQTESNIKI